LIKFFPTQRELKGLAAQVHSSRLNLSTYMQARHWLKIRVILDNCSCVVLMTHIPVRTLSKLITQQVNLLNSSS